MYKQIRDQEQTIQENQSQNNDTPSKKTDDTSVLSPLSKDNLYELGAH